MRKIFSFLMGLLAGAVVGGVTGLLLAPYAGSVLQERIRSGMDKLVEEGQRAAQARQAELEVQLEAFKRGEPITIETTPDQ